ncbi:uncharacterized protein LOC112092116 [Morus notabilis]|uniref:uncharacterized protein LOC112092116 n=1 Tax=Morus notabilis TaxID=981085 RepID=UPI000CED7CBD|nr:uncharacterized protein LOC112092116 [Morus notabilis]
METFYNGLNGQTWTIVDASANGAILAKTYNEAYEILERMANNNYQWPTERAATARRVAGVHEVDAVTALTAQVSSLASILNSMNQGVNSPQFTVVSCIYYGEGHLFDNCPSNPESACYVGNFNKNHNLYSNTYNLGWRQHPNFSWNSQGQNVASSSTATCPQHPPGFPQHPRHQPAEQHSSMEHLLKEYMAKNDAIIQNQSALIQNQAASLRNLENQVGQLANALTSHPTGALPSNTKDPRREEPTAKHTPTLQQSLAKKQNDRPPPPFPQRFQKQQQDKQFKRFLDVLKQLHINIPLVEAFEQIPSYVKFMKDILSKKRRLGEFETVAMTEESSSILHNKIPPKLKGPGSFTIPRAIGNNYFGKALCDLRASINLMPMSIFKKLGIGEAWPTTVTLQLADRSLAHPEGKIENFLVKVDKFIFPIDFIILDYEADMEVPIILGRPFLAIGRTLIDVQKGELTMRVNDEQVTFNVLKAMRFPDEVEECSVVNVMDTSALKGLEQELEGEIS